MQNKEWWKSSTLWLSGFALACTVLLGVQEPIEETILLKDKSYIALKQIWKPTVVSFLRWGTSLGCTGTIIQRIRKNDLYTPSMFPGPTKPDIKI